MIAHPKRNLPNGISEMLNPSIVILPLDISTNRNKDTMIELLLFKIKKKKEKKTQTNKIEKK